MVQLNAFTVLGPSADAELKQAQSIAFDGVVSNVLVPRMVALLETTMWHQVRDPDYLLSALKAYYMMTVPVGYDAEFLKDWWQQQLPLHAPINPFQTDSALTYQLAALDLLGGDETKIAPDKALLAAALESVCTIPLSVWAYKDLMQDPVVTALPNWIPSDQAGPNGTTVLTRLSGKTLRVGLPGAFTFDGFHQTILPLVPQVAERAAKNRAGLAGGCGTSSAGAEATLQTDILKLYSDDFIAQWDGFLHDVRLAPITSQAVATTNLKDLGGPDSALKHLLGAVVTETDLTFEPEAAATATPVPAGGLGAKVSGVVKKVKKIVPGVGNPTEVAPSSGPPPGTDIAAPFAPLKATIQEVDGQPPLLTDTQTAIGALANELQTVLATPDPEATLLARGGLPELTGAIANLSKTLPDPVNGWIAGIAGDTMSVTRDSVLAQLNAYWNADVRPFCTRATDHRYPFDVNQANDVTLDDFGKLFRPAGLIDSFTNEQLAPYIDTSVPIWAWRSDLGLDAATLVPFQRARSIRDALFPGGAGPIMTFTLLPKNLSANASRVTLNLDGQQLIFFNSAPQATKMSWPGTNGTNQISLSFAPLDGSTEVMTTVNGPWAWLRMIRKGKLAATDLPELFHLTLDLGGFSVSFDLTAGSVENPFNLKMFSGFKCPESF